MGADIVVWDLDSTLADTRPRRHLCPTVDPARSWQEYALACQDDLPVPGAVRLHRMLHEARYSQHILSWRCDTARLPTIRWLFRHRIHYDRLRLRRPGDSDDSTAYKLDYLNQLRLGGHTVELVVEDWPATATAIAAAGFPVLCVNPCYGEPA